MVSVWLVGPGLGKRFIHTLIGLLCIATALLQGSNANREAFNRCVGGEGPALREALASHKATHGAFPESLAQLDTEPLCARPLLGSMAHYAKTPEGYALWFGSLVTHSATAASDFEAHK